MLPVTARTQHVGDLYQLGRGHWGVLWLGGDAFCAGEVRRQELPGSVQRAAAWSRIGALDLVLFTDLALRAGLTGGEQARHLNAMIELPDRPVMYSFFYR